MRRCSTAAARVTPAGSLAWTPQPPPAQPSQSTLPLGIPPAIQPHHVQERHGQPGQGGQGGGPRGAAGGQRGASSQAHRHPDRAAAGEEQGGLSPDPPLNAPPSRLPRAPEALPRVGLARSLWKPPPGPRGCLGQTMWLGVGAADSGRPDEGAVGRGAMVVAANHGELTENILCCAGTALPSGAAGP